MVSTKDRAKENGAYMNAPECVWVNAGYCVHDPIVCAVRIVCVLVCLCWCGGCSSPRVTRHLLEAIPVPAQMPTRTLGAATRMSFEHFRCFAQPTPFPWQARFGLPHGQIESALQPGEVEKMGPGAGKENATRGTRYSGRAIPMHFVLNGYGVWLCACVRVCVAPSMCSVCVWNACGKFTLRRV